MARARRKQTVFYLEEPLALEEGDTIEGTFGMRPNPDNHRELDVLHLFTGQTPSFERPSPKGIP